MEIECIGNARYSLGEGPLWDPIGGVLYWVDSHAPAIWRHDPSTGDIEGWDLPGGTVGSIALRERGGAVLAMDDGFHFFDFDTGAGAAIADVEAGEPKTRFNDGKVDRRGRFVAGSMHEDLSEPLGALYRLDADFGWVRLDGGITCSNGPCWSPDGRTFYFADSPRRTIWAYDYDLDAGALANKRVFVSTGAFDAFPDGATVDAEGHLWSALFGSGRIARFAPDGSLDRTVELPVAWVSSVMFGGPGLDVLFAISIGGRLLDERDPSPDAGALFAIHGLGVKGLPEPRFAG